MKLLSFSLSILFLLTACGKSQRSPAATDEVVGVKHPGPGEEGPPVTVPVQAAKPGTPLPGYSELVPFALRSPDQEEAGSCLYMSLTGIAEWWLARLSPDASRAPEGPLDLSERYLMNVAGYDEASNGVKNWKTDSVFLFNNTGKALRNADYRFTKGWYVTDTAGNRHRSAQGKPGAKYDANVNWVDELAGAGKAAPVKLPRFSRDVLFADPASNQWGTGVMPDDIADRIKSALRDRKAPVHVIYNHYGYWHATVILGYDDQGDNQSCRFVNRFFAYMTEKANDARARAAQAKDPTDRDRLLRSAAKYEAGRDGARRAYDRGGGCHPGVFYVRDSIYSDPQGPVYHYDPANPAGDARYVKPVVMLEYDWVRTMANHAVQILAN